jgi:hypothetical protein
MISCTLRLLYHRGNSMKHPSNRCLWWPPAVDIVVLEKRKIACLCQESNQYSSSFQLVATRCPPHAQVFTQHNNKTLITLCIPFVSGFFFRTIIFLSTSHSFLLLHVLGSFLFHLFFLSPLKLLFFFHAFSYSFFNYASCFFFPSLFLASSRSRLSPMMTKHC